MEEKKNEQTENQTAHCPTLLRVDGETSRLILRDAGESLDTDRVVNLIALVYDSVAHYHGREIPRLRGEFVAAIEAIDNCPEQVTILANLRINVSELTSAAAHKFRMRTSDFLSAAAFHYYRIEDPTPRPRTRPRTRAEYGRNRDDAIKCSRRAIKTRLRAC